MECKKRGIVINRKKVIRLMRKENLRGISRKKKKYSSYKGEIGKTFKNEINRKFRAEDANKKWYTDVTEFAIGDKKLYLSPILDGYNYEIVSYNLSTSPNLEQVDNMLKKAFDKNPNVKDLIFHTDQGWQYQHYIVTSLLEEKGIKQSMSRKGNSEDNGLMENFFGLLKCEMFYQFEKTFTSIEHLSIEIEKYIEYYNTKRIKENLDGKSPYEYKKDNLVASGGAPAGPL